MFVQKQLLLHMHATAEGHSSLPTDLPHKLTQGLLILLFSAVGIAGFGVNIQLFFFSMVFLREYFLVLHHYSVSIYKGR